MVDYVDDSDEAFMRVVIPVSLTRAQWATVAQALTVQFGAAKAENPEEIGLALVAISAACAEEHSPAAHASGDLVELLKLAYRCPE